MRAYLNSIGDSLVIGEDDESFKVHVHTDIPGEALTEAQKYGTLELAKIENMRTQADDLAAGRKAQSTDDLDAIEAELEQAEQAARSPPRSATAFWRSAPATAWRRPSGIWAWTGVVSGGQTMNPSTEAILREVEPHPQRDRVRAAQQQEHHHGGPAVRGADGEAGHRGTHPQHPSGHHRHDERGSRRRRIRRLFLRP